MTAPTFIGRGFLGRVRWRLCWALMPKLWLAEEKRQLESIAREHGTSKAVSQRIASAYFNRMRDQK